MRGRSLGSLAVSLGLIATAPVTPAATGAVMAADPAPPRIAYVVADRLHTPDGTVRDLPETLGGEARFALVGETSRGWLVAEYLPLNDEQDEVAVHLLRDGDVETVLTTRTVEWGHIEVVLSRDRTRFLVRDDDGDGSVDLAVHDLTGKRLGTSRYGYDYQVLDFPGPTVLYGDEGQVIRWRVGGRQRRSVVASNPRGYFVHASVRHNLLMASVRSSIKVGRLDRPRRTRWTAREVNAFFPRVTTSPTGTLVAVGAGRRDRRVLVVRRTRDGRVRDRFRVDDVRRVAWESGRTFLVAREPEGAPSTLSRCTVGGGCVTLATSGEGESFSFAFDMLGSDNDAGG